MKKPNIVVRDASSLNENRTAALCLTDDVVLLCRYELLPVRMASLKKWSLRERLRTAVEIEDR